MKTMILIRILGSVEFRVDDLMRVIPFHPSNPTVCRHMWRAPTGYHGANGIGGCRGYSAVNEIRTAGK